MPISFKANDARPMQCTTVYIQYGTIYSPQTEPYQNKHSHLGPPVNWCRCTQGRGSFCWALSTLEPGMLHTVYLQGKEMKITGDLDSSSCGSCLLFLGTWGCLETEAICLYELNFRALLYGLWLTCDRGDSVKLVTVYFVSIYSVCIYTVGQKSI